MKIFISWSGERSRIIAEGLNIWLPKVIQAIKPFYSPEIEKGTKGIDEINKTLEGTSFGIICLTPDNTDSTWIHYEAGALSKIEGARIWTLLDNLKHSDIVQPLAQFQHTLASKMDIYRLLESINAKLSEPLETSVLRDSFERWWVDLETILQKAAQVVEEGIWDDIQIRSDRDILDEILEILRSDQRQNSRTTNWRLTSSQIAALNPSRINKSIQNRDEYIGVSFEYITENKTDVTPSYLKKYVSQFTSAVSKKINKIKTGFYIEIIFEHSFAEDMFNEIKEEIVSDLKEKVSSVEPIYIETLTF